MMHDEAAELLGAYAVGAVSPSEREQVEQHAGTCPICTEEVAELLSLRGELALLTEEREPPPALRTRLMSIVEQDRLEWQQRQAPVSIAQAARARSWWARVPRLAYGVSAAVVVAAVLLVVVLVSRNTLTITTYRGGAVAREVRGIHVAGATAAVEVRSDRATNVLLKNMPVLPPALSYELWLIPAQGAPVSLGGFEVRADHTFQRRYARDARGFAAVAVTIERAPGDWPTPTLSDLTLEVKLAV